MFRYRIDYREIRRAVKNFNDVKDIDVVKEVRWYLNQVYRDLSRKHGKRYSYVTPPSPERTNLRVRSRRLLNELRDSRFITHGKSYVTAGWDIPKGDPKGNYLGVHVADRSGAAPFNLTPANAKYVYTTKKGAKRILIPLKAGMTSAGTPKPITSRSNLKGMPYGKLVGRPGVDFSGENKAKFKANTYVLYKESGRKKIPMYIIVKKARIPRRLLLGPAMDRHKDELMARLEKQIDRELNRVSKK